MPGDPRLSAVIITKNRPSMLKSCLGHFSGQSFSSYEIVIVDSSDEPCKDRDIVAFPRVKYHYIGRISNICFSRNAGIRESKGGIIAFIDDDAEVGRGWAEACVASYASPEIGAAGGRVIDRDSEHLDHARAASICKILRSGLYTDNLDCERKAIEEIDHFMGCNMSVRRDVLERVGYFDENLSTFHDDLDMSIRIARAGFKIAFNSNMLVRHLALPSIYKTSIVQQNELLSYVYLKNYGLTWTKDRGPITIMFLLCARTGIERLLMRPSLSALAHTSDSYRGKLLGIRKYLFRSGARHGR